MIMYGVDNKSKAKNNNNWHIDTVSISFQRDLHKSYANHSVRALNTFENLNFSNFLSLLYRIFFCSYNQFLKRYRERVSDDVVDEDDDDDDGL